VRCRVQTSLIGLCVSFVAAGCVEGFRGSNIQIDLATATPAQASQGAVPRPDQLPANVHFTLYGIQTATDRERLFALETFEIHPIVDVSSPCFIDVGERVRFPGLHVSQFEKMVAEDVGIPDYRNPPPGATEEQKIDATTAAQRMKNIALLGADTGIKAVTSASVRQYPAVDADCNGTGLPPPMCTDAAANARRLAKCQEAWDADPDLWEGTDRVIVAPLAGTTYGLVDGNNPINLAPIGGAQFFVDEAVASMDAYALYYQQDDMEDPGNLLLYGTPTHPTRGISKVRLTSATNPLLKADLAIFVDLGEDDVHF
jgi:hypothetical protein